MEENEFGKSELTELFRAKDASCPKGKKMEENEFGKSEFVGVIDENY